MNDICPDCKRQKAKHIIDVKNGFCPKWWAIRDPEAEKDCKRYASEQPDALDQNISCSRCDGNFKHSRDCIYYLGDPSGK